MQETPAGCNRPPGASVEQTEEPKEKQIIKNEEKQIMSMARVGRKAPDFEVAAYQNGAFKNVKLADYAGKWLLICFYPGDFTFV